jgi:hypothetical protein
MIPVGMERAPKFTVSGNLYAVNPATFTRTARGKCLIDAVWYRRKEGVTYASIGRLWDFSGVESWRSFVDGIRTRIYGPSSLARFGPDGLWTPQAVTAVEAARLTLLLSPMLTDVPTIPDGYDGWWRFR